MKVDPSIEAGIRATMDVMFNAFIADDIDRWLQFLSREDPDIAWIATGPGEYEIGLENLERAIRASNAGSSNRTAEWDISTIAVEGKVAWISGEAGIGALAGGRYIWIPFRYTGVFVERGGRWLIAQFHQSVPDARQGEAYVWESVMDSVASEVERQRPDLSEQTAPDGTVTIVFTDIEDSTTLTAQLGDLRWIEVLREHNAIIRERLAAHGGAEVKTIGDAFMLAFPSARRALLCSIDIQRAFSAYCEEHRDEPIRVRIGLHAGEPVREGGDFYGKSVVFASRVAGDASGGEILASSLVRELAEAAGDIEFGAEREADLKGFAGPQRLHAVRWQH